jgi:hypothetical protein
MDLTALFQSEAFRDFTINVAAAVAWDATKATYAHVKSFISGAESTPLKIAYAQLQADESIRRCVQQCCDDAIKSIPDESKARLFNDSALFVDALLGFLKGKGGGATLTQRFREKVREVTSLDNVSDETIERFICVALIGLTSSDVGGFVQLRATEQVGSQVERLAGVAHQTSADLTSLGLDVRIIKEVVLASSPPLAGATAQLVPPSPKLSLWLDQLGLAQNQISALEIQRSLSSPTLPPHFVRRDKINAELETRLAARSVLAVTGYPESGKTLALADFIVSSNADCIWIALPAACDELELRQVILVALRKYLGCVSFAPQDIEAAIEKRKSSSPLVFVIDNAELAQDLNALQQLFDLSDAHPTRFRTLLAYSENPYVTHSARLAQIPTYRLPGLEVHEAAALFQKLGVNVTDTRLAAITMLCAYCDGHVGMLRLYRSLIDSIVNPADLARLELTALQTQDAAAFMDALLNKFMQLLSADEHELCRRLSITVYGFRQALAEALWTIDRAQTEFHSSWQQCAAGVFETTGSGLYLIPFLYKRGLQGQVSEEEAQRFHATAASHLATNIRGVIGLDDIYAVIFHHLCAAQYEQATDVAGQFLFSAFHDDRPDILRVLSPGIQRLLPATVVAAHVPLMSRVRYYALLMLVAHTIEQPKAEKRHATTLESLLSDEHIDDVPKPLITLAWVQLASYAARTGQPALAIKAVDSIPPEWATRVFETEHRVPVLLIIFSFFNSNEDVFSLFSELGNRLDRGQLTPKQLWDTSEEYELWRAIGTKVYQHLDKLKHTQPDAVQAKIDELKQFCARMKGAGLSDIAAIVGNTLVVAIIDLQRDFPAAIDLARTIIADCQVTDHRSEALLHHTLGDALRCGENNTAAEPEFRAALSLWPATSRYELSQSHMCLSISLARRNEHQDALVSIRRALRTWGQGDGIVTYTYEVRMLCEAAIIAMRAGYLRKSLVWLIRARQIMRAHKLNTREWPLIAQLGMILADHADGKRPASELPFPGYTLALPELLSGAENMIESAPEIALARACHALKFHHKAAEFAEAYYEALPNESLRQMQSVLSFEFALPTRDLRLVIRGAGRALCGKQLDFPEPPKVPYEVFLRDYVLARSVELSVSVASGSEAVTKIAEAQSQLSELPDSDRPLLGLLKRCLLGMKQSLSGNTDEELERAYETACELDAGSVARSLSWFWCFRTVVKRGRVVPADVVQWQWRLVWLTLAVGKSDAPFLDEFLRQMCDMWKEFVASGSFAILQNELVRLGADSSQTTIERLIAIEETLARANWTASGLFGFFPDVLNRLRGDKPRWLKDILRSTVRVVVNWVLSPKTAEHRDLIDTTLQCLEKIFALYPDEKEFDDLRSDTANVRLVHENVVLGQFNESGATALIQLRSYFEELDSGSMANWYLALWQAREICNQRPDIEKACEDYLEPSNIDSFLESHNDLPSGSVLRLRYAALSDSAKAALKKLHSGMQSLTIQSKLQGTPISRSAIAVAQKQFDEGLIELQKIGDAIRKILRENDLSSDLDSQWSFSFLLGHTSLQGALNKKLLNGVETAIVEFQAARNALVDALKVADQLKDNQKIAIASLALVGANTALGDQAAAETYRRRTIEAASAVGDEYSKDIQKSLDGTARLYGSMSYEEDHRELSEEEIGDYVDRIMTATGLPEDRRGNVLDDCRKIEASKKVQQTFCRHLQPLQNLEHTRHPATAYSRPTMYTCDCTLLHYRTHIEVKDIDTAVKAMQRAHCDECNQRSPGNGQI